MTMTLDTLSIVNGNLVNITAWTFTCPAGTDPVLATASRNAAADAIVDKCDVGSSVAQGYVKIQTSADVDLCQVNLANPAFGAASSGAAAGASLPKSGFATATGTAAKYRVYDRNNTEIWRGTCSL